MRTAVYETVSTSLSLLGDRRLGEVVAAATPLGSGIGGRSAELDVDGTRVFVKRVPLTDLELRPENLRSTANLFGLPTFYQYGVGSAGFGAWRELAAHVMTTNWVLAGAYEGFPLMYHWRVLPDSPPGDVADGLGGVDAAVAHWDGAPAVRRRIEALNRSTSSLVLFLEHVPWTLGDWLRDHGDPSAYPWIEESLTRGAAFMASRGFVHFDAHFGNVLTDGRSLYFADLGLALSSRFELTPEESAFHTAHLAYDRAYVIDHMLRHHLLGKPGGHAEYAALVDAWIRGERPAGVPAAVAPILDRHAHSSAVLSVFFRELLTVSKRAPYPAAEVERALLRPALRP